VQGLPVTGRLTINEIAEVADFCQRFASFFPD
jgi:hypothetical protein